MATAVVATERPGVPRRVWLPYGLPAFALAGPFNFVQFYFLNFATDVLLLAPAAVGTMIAAARAWDAISDPMAGYLSDRTRTRWGRRRPWMFVAAPMLALAFAALWSPPAGLGGQALWLWIGAALLLFTTATTGWTIPHYALGAELSAAASGRRKLFGLRFVSALSGVAAALALLGGSVAYVRLFWLQADAFLMAAGALAFAGFFMGCGGPVAPALLAEAVDDDADRSGQRKEGVYFAAWNFVDKCGSALVVLTLGLSLQLSGFEPNVAQQPAADLVMRACVSLLPACLFLVAAFGLSRLRLGDPEPRLV